MGEVALLDVPNVACVASGLDEINAWLGRQGVDGRDVLAFTVTTTPGAASRDLHVTELVRKDGHVQLAEHGQAPVTHRRRLRIFDQTLPAVTFRQEYRS
jgi:hypothetical protein